MTKRTTPFILSLLPIFVLACDSERTNSNSESLHADRSDGINDDVVSPPSMGTLNASPELATVDPSRHIGVNIDDDRMTPSDSLECATTVFHYDFDGMPESVRVQLKRAGNQIEFAYQYADVHSKTPGSTLSGPWNVQGLAVGSWDEDTIELSLGGTDTIGMGDFEMELSRDSRVTGDVYTGLGSIGSASFGIEMSCWDPNLEPDFLYDGESGLCTNVEGEIGTNPWPIHMVRESLDGECVNFSSSMINEENYSHVDLVGWNLQGAVLSESTLHFGNLVDAELEGADLSGLEYGYADISGTTDVHTRLPTEGCSLADSGELYCHR
jgi:hypothetical protein